MESKQITAVEWMFDKLLEEGSNGTLRWHLKYDIFKILEQAKAMEKEQIVMAYHNGYSDAIQSEPKQYEPEQYFNQTYGPK
jgi:hypothetical protein